MPVSKSDANTPPQPVDRRASFGIISLAVGPVAQLAEQLTLNGSLPGKPGSDKVSKSGNPDAAPGMAIPSQALTLPAQK